MLHTPLMQEIERSGFDTPGALIHSFVGGSELHGAKVGKTDDLDIYGIFLERPDEALGWNSAITLCGRRQRMNGGMARMTWM